jgi:alpha-beta hydrolase superfamily lysophospholipase
MMPTSSTVEKNILFLPLENKFKIPVRVNGVEARNTPLIMLHGLQSHSGWFTQSASFISSLGNPVYAMDRYGSGMSRAPKGAYRPLEDSLKDIKAVAGHIMAKHKTDKVFVLGHCFGALLASAFAIMYKDTVKGVILPTPAIFTKTGPGLTDMVKIVWSKVSGINIKIPVPLEPEMMSGLEEYVAFIKNDPLALKTADAAFFLQIPKIRSFVTKKAEAIDSPVFMAFSGKDPICANEKNRAFFDSIRSADKTLKTYDRARHILEFSAERDDFFEDLRVWLREHE